MSKSISITDADYTTITQARDAAAKETGKRVTYAQVIHCLLGNYGD